MKKIIMSKFTIFLLITTCICGCSQPANVSDINIQISSSNYYSTDEIKVAMNVVIESFKSTDFDNCTLTDLWYNEDEVLNQQLELLKQDNNRQVIVLYSNFKTGLLSNENPLSSNTGYNQYKWILEKKTNEDWSLIDSGF